MSQPNYDHMLEAADDLKSLCVCGKPAKFIYWGFEATVCSPECAAAMDAEYEAWYLEHADDEPATTELGLDDF